jgi:hypothetical protein
MSLKSWKYLTKPYNHVSIVLEKFREGRMPEGIMQLVKNDEPLMERVGTYEVSAFPCYRVPTHFSNGAERIAHCVPGLRELLPPVEWQRPPATLLIHKTTRLLSPKKISERFSEPVAYCHLREVMRACERSSFDPLILRGFPCTAPVLDRNGNVFMLECRWASLGKPGWDLFCREQHETLELGSQAFIISYG